jgi:alpha-L-rhamnosidase
MNTNKFPAKTVNFEKAAPVWPIGRESEINLWLSFRAVAKGAKSTLLRLTGSSAYTVKVDGEFVAFGPARCAHGFWRVDELDISEYVHGESVVTIDVAGYSADSFYHIDQPSFLCAELIENGEVTAATGEENDFLCRVMTEHEQKAERYAGQRTFCEVYNLTPDVEAWEKDIQADVRKYALILTYKTEEKTFIARGCGYNLFDVIPAEKIVSRIKFKTFGGSDGVRYPEYIVPRGRKTGPSKKDFSLGEVETDLFLKARNIDITELAPCEEANEEITFAEGEGATYKMAFNTTGEIELSAECEEDTEILVRFDEFLGEDGSLNFRRMYTVNAVLFRIKKGSYRLATFEPYTMGAMQVLVTKGKAKISGVSLRYFGDDKTERKYAGDDADMKKIFEAAVETYRQNAFTIYMDCPSRERAGWLCDSFFTSRAEKVLMGRSTVEKNFLENFFLPDSFKDIPHGMFPMCYPGDQYGGNYIPNWAMWLVIELSEYLERTGDREFVDAARPRIEALLSFLAKYENADGLLEKLDRWVFVEWSKANELTQDINYPTNMLYAHMLEAAAHLYGDSALTEKAKRIKAKINEQAVMPDGFYCDNSVYGEDGKAHLSGVRTEACQYYAFFCGVATPAENPVLWERLLNDFGPDRVEKGKWPNLSADAKWKNVHPANAFIGNYLRLEILCRYGENEKLYENIRGYFLKMANLTGTLWENDGTTASCNHGFASHVVYWMDKLSLLS